MESCKELAKEYVQALVESLKFANLSFFNFVRLFSPYHYVHDVCGREENSKH
jgi:hypothetical protein